MGHSLFPRDTATVMRNAFFSILPVSLCIAFLLSTVPLHPAQRRPKMLGADHLKLDDAVRLAQRVEAAAGGDFAVQFRSAVQALEAAAEAGPKLVSGQGRASLSSVPSDPVFLFSSNPHFSPEFRFGPLPLGPLEISVDFHVSPMIPPPKSSSRVGRG